MGHEEAIARDGQPGVDASHGLKMDLVMATAMQKMQDLPAEGRGHGEPQSLPGRDPHPFVEDLSLIHI